MPKPLKFTKMHGLGNDFMVIDGVRQSLSLSKELICKWSDRHTGIGFDQCLIVEPSDNPNIDFFYRIFNADGQEVGQCGNGARCLARFVEYYGLTHKKEIRVATSTTQMNLIINSNETVTVDFGVPRFLPAEIPLLKDQQASTYELILANGNTHSFHAVNVGNPHAVTVVNDVNAVPIEILGKEISEHPIFPQQTNAGFMQIIQPNHLKLRVYERGCGETLACGSGAVAAAIVGKLFYTMQMPVTVTLPGGDLSIKWSESQNFLYLTGPASFIFEGNMI